MISSIEQFIELKNYFLYIYNNDEINYRNEIGIFKKILDIKLYMIDNKYQKEVIDFKNFLDKIIIDSVLKKDFYDYLYLNSEFKYEKIINLFINRPFSNDKTLALLSSIMNFESIYFGSFRNFMVGCIEYLKKMGLDIKSDYSNLVEEFYENNISLFRGTKDMYPANETESLNKYLKYLKREFDPDFKNFKNGLTHNMYNRRELSQYEIESKYINCALGKLGEYHYYNSVINEQALKFCSRDIGNGLGYDIYFKKFLYNTLMEHLIEVKTTVKYNLNSNDDEFYLSQNEIDVINNVYKENRYNVIYLISRLFYIKDKNNYENLMLQYVGNNTFRCLEYPNIEYNIDLDKNNDIFVKRKKLSRM